MNSYLIITDSIFKFVHSVFNITHSIFKFVHSKLKLTIQHSSSEFKIQVYNSTFKFIIQHSSLKFNIQVCPFNVQVWNSYSSLHIQRSSLEFNIQVQFANSSLSRDMLSASLWFCLGPTSFVKPAQKYWSLEIIAVDNNDSVLTQVLNLTQVMNIHSFGWPT